MYLTFDVGTSSVKTALFDKTGTLIARATREYSLETPRPNWCQVDPEVYWTCVREGFAEILGQRGVNPKAVRGICGSSQGETVVFLDEHGVPTYPALVWLDGRADVEARTLAAKFDPQEFYATTGIVEMNPGWSAPKILWLRAQEPQCFAKAAHVLLVEDYIVWKLTGQFTAVPSLWATSGLIDINSGSWWSAMVDHLKVREKLPRLVSESAVLGPILPRWGGEWGLSEGCLVIKGSMDQTLGAVGSSNVGPGMATETTGTALVLAVSAPASTVGTALNLPYLPHVVPDTRIVMPFIKTAGILYKWLATQVLGYDEASLQAAYENLNQEVSRVPAGSEGLFILPYFTGIGTGSGPENQGVVAGLTLRHGRGHLARAVQESVAYLLKDTINQVEAAGIPVVDLRSMGGAARSRGWLQIKASVTGLRVVPMDQEEAPSLGAAVATARALGDYDGWVTAAAAMIREGRELRPIPEEQSVYQRQFAEFQRLRSRIVSSKGGDR